jgi:hypothetical protein
MPEPLLASFRGVFLAASLLALSLMPGSAAAQGTGPSDHVDHGDRPRWQIHPSAGSRGAQTVVFRWLGYRPTEARVTVEPGSTVTADAALEPVAIALTELVVEGASRAPERIVEAPAAISVVEPQVLQNTSITVEGRCGCRGACRRAHVRVV